MWPFGGAKKRRVLVVDDDVNVRTMLVMYFQDSGWEVQEAPDGRAGSEAAVASPPDVILLDIDMPVLNGRTTLAVLRSNPRTAGVPVVMVTARAGLDDVDDCLSGGASDYVTKPFDFSKLAAKIDRLVPPR